MSSAVETNEAAAAAASSDEQGSTELPQSSPITSDEDLLNCQKYVLNKMKHLVENRDISEAVSYLESIFVDQRVEFERSVLYHSGFDGEAGEEIPFLTTLPIKFDDILRLCFVIVAGSTEDPDAMFQATTGRLGSCRCSSSWRGDHMAYRCRTCGLSDSSCMCVDCFDPKEHEGHNFRLYKSPSGGCCDCGDPLAWRPEGFCKKHQVPDENVDPSLALDVATRHRIEVAVYCTVHHLLLQSEHAKIMKIDVEEEPGNFKSYIQSEKYMAFEQVYLSTTGWLKRLADSCDALRKIICDFFLATRRVGMGDEELKRAGERFELLDPLTRTIQPPIKTIFLFSPRMREECQTQTAMLHLGLLFSSRFKENYTSYFVFEYPKYISLILKGPDFQITKGVGGFLDRIFCQLFHSPEQVLRLTERSNLVISLVRFITQLLELCRTTEGRQNSRVITHAVAGIPKKCIDSGDPLLGSERQARSRMLTDLKTLVGHNIVAQSIFFSPSRNKVFGANGKRIGPFFKIMFALQLAQAMNIQKRETGNHVTYESDSYKAAFMLELEMVQLARMLAKVITDPELEKTDHVQRAIRNVVGCALFSLKDWLAVAAYGEAHAESFINRACPQSVSFHYPLHRSVGSILREYFSQNPLMSIADVLAINKDGDAPTSVTEKQDKAESLVLTLVEHPLLVLTLVAQIEAGRWARNGRSMRIQILYYRNRFWYDITYEMDIFLLQMGASVIPGEKFVSLVMSRFEVGGGTSRRATPYRRTNARVFCLGRARAGSSHFNSNFYKYFPGLKLGEPNSTGTQDPKIPFLGNTSERFDFDWMVGMGENFLMLIAQLVSDRSVIGENVEVTLRRSIVHWLAVQDFTYSQIQEKISGSLFSSASPNTELDDQERFQQCLELVSTFRAPAGSSLGRYTLKDECWHEIDLLFLHWSRQERQKVLANYSSFYEFKVKQDPDFFSNALKNRFSESTYPPSSHFPPPKDLSAEPIYRAFRKLPENMLSSRTLHWVVFSVLYNTLVGANNRTSDTLIHTALRLLEMCVQFSNNLDEEVPGIPLRYAQFESDNIFVNLCALVPLINNKEPVYSTPVQSARRENASRVLTMLDARQAARRRSGFEVRGNSCSDNRDFYGPRGDSYSSEDDESAGSSGSQNVVSRASLFGGDAPRLPQSEGAPPSLPPPSIMHSDGSVSPTRSFHNETPASYNEAETREARPTMSMLQILCYLLEVDDMEPYHASLQHVVNMATARSDSTMEVYKALKVRVFGEGAFGASSQTQDGVETEKERLENEARDRQTAILQRFAEQQKAFLMEDSESETSDEDSDSDSGDEEEEGSGTVTYSTVDMSETSSSNVSGEFGKEALSDKKRSPPGHRSRGNSLSSEGVCALCHDGFDDLSKHGHPGMLAYVHKNFTLRHMDYQYCISTEGKSVAATASSSQSVDSFQAFGEKFAANIGGTNYDISSPPNAANRFFYGPRPASAQIFVCGHSLHLNCYKEYVSSFLQGNRAHVSGPTVVNGREGEFLCPLCRRICNIIIPLHHTGGKRQHLYKETSGCTGAFNGPDVETFKSMKDGTVAPQWRKPERHDWEGKGTFGDSNQISQIINTYQGQEYFLYEYSNFFFQHVYPPKSTVCDDSWHNFCSYLTKHGLPDSMVVSDLHGRPPIETRTCGRSYCADMIRTISKLLSETVQLSEAAARSVEPGFGMFAEISSKEIKSLHCFADSLMLISELPHLRTFRDFHRAKAQDFLFSRGHDNIILSQGTRAEYKPLLLCGELFETFCSCVIATGTGCVDQITRTLFIASFMACRIKAIRCKLGHLRNSSENNDMEKVRMALLLRVKMFNSLAANIVEEECDDDQNKGEDMGRVEQYSRMINTENLKLCTGSQNDESIIDELISEFFVYVRNGNSARSYDGPLLASICETFISGEYGVLGDEGVQNLLVEMHENDHGMPSCEKIASNSMSCDDITRALCLPFLRQCYIFRRYCAAEEHLARVDGAGLTANAEFDALVNCMNLPLLGVTSKSEMNASPLCEEDRKLCALWVDQVRTYLHFEDHSSSSFDYIVSPKNTTLPMPYVLTKLPEHFTDLFLKYSFRKAPCDVCGKVPKHPALCLTCGYMVCGATTCAQSTTEGGCTAHAAACGGNTGAFLFIKECALLLCMQQNRRCFYPALYLDEHGEEDPDLKRGKLLHLEKSRFENLRQMMVSSKFEHTTQVLQKTSRSGRGASY